MEAVGDRAYSNEHFMVWEKKLLQVKDRSASWIPHHLHLLSSLLGSLLAERKPKGASSLFKDSEFKDQHYELMEQIMGHVTTLGLMVRFRSMSCLHGIELIA